MLLSTMTWWTSANLVTEYKSLELTAACLGKEEVTLLAFLGKIYILIFVFYIFFVLPLQ